MSALDCRSFLRIIPDVMRGSPRADLLELGILGSHVSQPAVRLELTGDGLTVSEKRSEMLVINHGVNSLICSQGNR